MDNSAILQLVLATLIQVFVPILVGVLIVLAKRGIDYVKANVDQSQLDFAMQLAKQFVLAAEQTGLTNVALKEGDAKKEWALMRLESELDKKGIKIDLDMLSNLIESVVFDELNKNK